MLCSGLWLDAVFEFAAGAGEREAVRGGGRAARYPAAAAVL